jgi:hypothetical protein
MTRLLLPRLWHTGQSPLAYRVVTAVIPKQVTENSVSHIDWAARSMLLADFSHLSMWMTEFSITHMFWSCVTLGFVNSVCQWSHNHYANCQHSPSCCLHELPQVCGPFSAALAVRAMVVNWRIAAVPARYAKGWIWIRSQVIAKSVASGAAVFTAMDELYGSQFWDGQFFYFLFFY